MRLEPQLPGSLFSPLGGVVGRPLFGRENPLAPGGRLPGLPGPYLARLNDLRESEKRQFGLGDHIGVPISHLDAQLTASLAQTAQGLMARARTLKAAADPLVSGTTGGAFDRRVASSSSTAVAAQVLDGATATGYDVDVTQLAVAQQNVGSQLLTTLAPSTVTAGLHTVDITVGGVTTSVNVDVNSAGAAGYTNLQALTDIKAAINAAGADVEATIVTTADVSQLVLTATETGTANAFTVSDAVGSSIVADTGIATATRSATDAQVAINGVEQTLSDNTLRLDVPQTGGTERLVLTFQAVTEETVHVDVNVSLNADVIVSAAKRLVGAVNDLTAFVADKPKILSSGLVARLSAAADGLRASLAAVGITATDEDGFKVEEATLRTALERQPAEVERAVGSIQGLAARERSVAETLMSSSLAFATKPGPLGTTYTRVLQQTARLHNLVASGLFVNVLA